LKPNLTGNIKIKDVALKDVVVLPISLVQEDRNGNNYVFALQAIEGENNVYTVTKKVLELGKMYKGKVVVKSGLQTNDLLALQGARGLTEGDKVKISNLASLSKDKTSKKQEEAKKTLTHTVKKGETLFSIHKKYNVSLDDLKKWNKLKNNNVHVGQKLQVSL
jgi:LysM repeat protein